MKTFEKKVARFIFSNRMKSDMVFMGYVNGLEYYGNSYFFGRLADNFFDKEKFKKFELDKIVKDWIINPDDDKLIKPDFYITKGDNKLELANFKLSYDSDHAPIAEVSCNYNYYKLFEKDVAFIYDTKSVLFLYDENKSLIGFIAKIVNYKDGAKK